MKFNLDQVKQELSGLVFARVLKVVEVTDSEHYFAFADQLTLKTTTTIRIFFQKTSRRDFIHIGPVRYGGTDEVKVQKRDVVVGEIEVLPKGPSFKWWISGATSLFNFTKYIHRQFTPKKNSSVLYQQLKMPNESDDLWALFLLVTGDVVDFVNEKTGTNRIRHPTKRLNQYQHQKGFKLSRPIEDFVFLSTLFSRQVEIFEQFKALCEKRNVTSIVWKTYYDTNDRVGGIEKKNIN